MSKLAAIYVRTSSEHQGEKASPKEQERDCRQLAEREGLEVIAVYRDIKKYRSKRKLVDPSGTRSDRPGLLAMLKDARAGKFDTILAWREDRLYRGYRPMLNVLEVVQDCDLNILLAMETFDAKMTPIKVWFAQQELEALKERMTMGVKKRLRDGKANTGQDRFGYQRNGEVIEIVEEEARWVRKIFEWYIEGTPIMKIRDRLIAGGAPQKGSAIPRKIQWARSSIQGVLKSAEVYATGIKIHTRDGEAFEIPVPPIIDGETYRQFKKRRKQNKTWPARNIKYDYLAAGLIYCPCGRKWGSRTQRKKRKSGEIYTYGVYYCGQMHKEVIHEDCPRTIGTKKADDFLWEKVLEVLDNPDVLLAGAREQIDRLRKSAEEAENERQRLQGELEALAMERQAVIRLARKGTITEEDLERQLKELAMQEPYIRGELAELEVSNSFVFSDNWEAAVMAFLADLRAGVTALDTEAKSKEARDARFDLKRRTALALVDKVLIGRERRMTVLFKLDVLELLSSYLECDCSQNKVAETYTDIPDLNSLFIRVSLGAEQEAPQ